MPNMYYFEELPRESQRMALAFFQDQYRDDPLGYDLSEGEAVIMAGHYLFDISGHPLIHFSEHKQKTARRAAARLR